MKLGSKLGEGGMAEVWSLELPEQSHPLALKILRASLRHNPDARARMQREIELLRQLDHPHLPTYVSQGQSRDERPFFIMHQLQGICLAAHLQDTAPLETSRASHIIDQLLEVLEYIHQHEVVHRDIKPSNLHLDPAQQDHLVLYDFGAAIKKSQHSLSPANTRRKLTAPGQTMGTPHYASPEQILGKAGDSPSVDLYAAGVLLYEMLTGWHPFEDEDAQKVLWRILREQPTPLRAFRQDLSPAWQNFIDQALAKAPDERFADASTMRAALRQTMLCG